MTHCSNKIDILGLKAPDIGTVHLVGIDLLLIEGFFVLWYPRAVNVRVCTIHITYALLSLGDVISKPTTVSPSFRIKTERGNQRDHGRQRRQRERRRRRSRGEQRRRWRRRAGRGNERARRVHRQGKTGHQRCAKYALPVLVSRDRKKKWLLVVWSGFLVGEGWRRRTGPRDQRTTTVI